MGTNLHGKKMAVRPGLLAAAAIVVASLSTVGGLFTVGIWGPFFTLSLMLLFFRVQDIRVIFAAKNLQIVCLIFFLVGSVVFLSAGVAYAISWFITAVLLSLSFGYIRKLFATLGLVLPYMSI